MTPKNDIDNELTRFLNGDTSLAAEEWLAESDEHVDDLLNIVAAIEAQHDAVRLRRSARRRLFLSVAAGVAALVAVAAVFFSRGYATVQTEQAPSYASADTVTPLTTADSFVTIDTL